MKYEKPMIEVILFGNENIVRTSLIGEGSGGGPEVGGDGDQDWN